MPITRTIRALDQSWQLLITRNMPLWHQCLSSMGNIRYRKDYGLKTPLYMLALTKEGNHTQVFYSVQNLKHMQKELLGLLRDERAMRRLERIFVRKGNDLKRTLHHAREIPTPRTWRAFCREYARYTPALNITALGGRIGTERLIRLLAEARVSDRDVPLGVLTYPTKHTPVFQSQLDLLSIGAKIQAKKLDRPAKTAALREWLNCHGHIPVNFCENPWTMRDARVQLAQLMKNDCATELQTLTISHQRKINQTRNLLRSMPDEIGTLARSLQSIIILNEYRKNVFSYVSRGMTDVYRVIAERMGLATWQDCHYFTPDELEDGLRRKQRFWKKIIRQRQVVAYASRPNGSIRFLTASTAKRLASFAYGTGTTRHKRHGTTLRGLSANPGVARGLVRVILGSKDFPNIKRGEILVAPMTSVDYIPIMERAAAFVTNEGGITSHAAIISREMNKPCIVGTQTATITLKDGDKVLVDANRGIVSKL